MLFELFAAGSWPFVVAFIIIPSLILFSLADSNQGGSASAVVVVTLLLMALITSFNPFSWTINNPTEAAKYFLYYVVLGVLFGGARWFFYVRDQDKTYGRHRAEELPKFLADNNLQDLSDPAMQTLFRRHMLDELAGDYPPHARNNKARITTWMALWPFSGIGMFLTRPLKWIANAMYEYTANFFNKISAKIFGKYAEFDGHFDK